MTGTSRSTPFARPIRVAHVVTHPIQYFAPLYRELTRFAGIELTVWFGSAFGTTPSLDPGLGTTVLYDADLTGGFTHGFLTNRGDGVPGDNSQSFDCPTLVDTFDPAHIDVVWVHGWGYELQRQAARWATRHGVPYVIRGESTLIEAPRLSLRWTRRFIKFSAFCRRAAGCLYVGEQNRRFYRSLGIPARRLFPAHYSINADFFARRGEVTDNESPRDRRTIRESLAVGDDDLVVVTVCKLIDRKRVADLIQAIAVTDSRVRLWVVGTGEREMQLKTLANSLAPERVHFLGFKNQSERPAILAAADVFVLASSEETWGLVVNEAMACGLPAIVSDRVGCAADLIKQGETGFIYPCGDYRQLGALLTKVAADRPQCNRMGKSAQQLVERQYSSQATANQIYDAVKAVVKRRE